MRRLPDAIIGIEDLRDHPASLFVCVGGAKRSLLVLVARAGHAEDGQELRELPSGAQLMFMAE
jgi:hypothetical protein